MGERMNKEQVIEATIGVLGEISVPIRLKKEITEPIEGAINNLVIVLSMIRAEAEANAADAEPESMDPGDGFPETEQKKEGATDGAEPDTE